MKKIIGLAILLMISVSAFAKSKSMQINETEWGLEVLNIKTGFLNKEIYFYDKTDSETRFFVLINEKKDSFNVNNFFMLVNNDKYRREDEKRLFLKTEGNYVNIFVEGNKKEWNTFVIGGDPFRSTLSNVITKANETINSLLIISENGKITDYKVYYKTGDIYIEILGYENTANFENIASKEKSSPEGYILVDVRAFPEDCSHIDSYYSNNISFATWYGIGQNVSPCDGKVKRGSSFIECQNGGYLVVRVDSLFPQKIIEDIVKIDTENFWEYFQLKPGNYQTYYHLVYTRKLEDLIQATSGQGKYKSENFIYSLNEEGAVSIDLYIGKSIDAVTIPNEISELPVTSIKSMQSITNGKIKSVIIPKTVKKIEKGAFENLGLEKIMFANGSVLTKIEEMAFANNKIKECNIPMTIEYIGKKAFYNNELGELKLPRKKLRIGDDAFGLNKVKKISICPKWDNQNIISSDELEEVWFEDGCTYIGEGAFANCSKLKKISIPATIKKIYKYAFSKCNSLSEIEFREGVFRFEVEDTGFFESKPDDKSAFLNCPLSLKTKSRLLQAGLTNAAFE